MAVEVRKSWIMAGGGFALVCAVLGWAWADGGQRPLTPRSEPAMLPQVGR